LRTTRLLRSGSNREQKSKKETNKRAHNGHESTSQEPELKLSLSSCPHRRHQRTECAIKVTLELSPAGEWMDSDRFPKQLVNCEADLRAILHP
jgi:hypothetical protein